MCVMANVLVYYRADNTNTTCSERCDTAYLKPQLSWTRFNGVAFSSWSSEDGAAVVTVIDSHTVYLLS